MAKAINRNETTTKNWPRSTSSDVIVLSCHFAWDNINALKPKKKNKRQWFQLLFTLYFDLNCDFLYTFTHLFLATFDCTITMQSNFWLLVTFRIFIEKKVFFVQENCQKLCSWAERWCKSSKKANIWAKIAF